MSSLPTYPKAHAVRSVVEVNGKDERWAHIIVGVSERASGEITIFDIEKAKEFAHQLNAAILKVEKWKEGK